MRISDWSSDVCSSDLWHLHAALFLLALGYAYTVNAHVRVDLLREKLSDRGQAWIELLGICLLMLPYILVVMYYGWTFVHQAWESNEASDRKSTRLNSSH